MTGAIGNIAVKILQNMITTYTYILVIYSWERSLLNHMGYVKRKCSTAEEVTISEFDEVNEIFVAYVAAQVVMREISKELIFGIRQVYQPYSHVSTLCKR